MCLKNYVFSTTFIHNSYEDDLESVLKAIGSFYLYDCTDEDLYKLLHDFDDSITGLEMKLLKDTEGVVTDYNISLIRKVSGSENDFKMNLDWESRGTKKYLFLLIDAIIVFKNGGALLVDEFDSNLHPIAQNKFIQLFENPEINKKNAQLIFNSQNTSLLM